MEQLNKQQIILLALLVSFVSSIATGIVTVSLMEQGAGTPVTQTINRVVERTIERVSSDDSPATKETIVVRDDEAVVKAIAIASKGIVRIFATRPGSTEEFVGLGVIANSSGRVIARLGLNSGGPLVARLDGGNSVPLFPVSYDSNAGVTILSAEQSESRFDARVYSAVRFADSADASLGQAVVAIGGGATPRVATGIVSSKNSSYIEASVRDAAFDTHAILVNLLGEVIGMKNASSPPNSFIASDIIKPYATP
ncbi:MAG: S1C family serine protease [bacterium]|nr:S1C family serine protease [bacterium]